MGRLGSRRDEGKPLLICFAGIDGSGKTTQAQRLVDWMKRQGVQSEYVWSIFEPWLLKPFMKTGRALFLREKDMFKDYTEYFDARRGLFRYPLASAFFHYCFFGEYLLRFLPQIRLLLMRGRSVICDRYVYDAVAGLAADLEYPDGKIRATVNHLLYLMPEPDLTFLIDLPEETAYQRKDDVPSVGYLEKRRQIYLDLAKEYGMTILDGSRDLTELENLIQDKVRGKLKMSNCEKEG